MVVNSQNENLYSRGSEWRKWDMHIHPPKTKLNDGYRIDGNKDCWDEFCEEIKQSDVEVLGITDYFSADGYWTFIKKYQNKYPNSKKKFFLNIELRLNESVNQKQEEVNVHLIFNPTSLDKVDEFLNKLSTNKTGKDGKSVMCSDLNTLGDYESATVSRDSIDKAFEGTFGEKAIRQNHVLVFTAANNDGIRPASGKQRKEVITDEIDKFSDGFFGGTQNQKYYLNNKRLEEESLTRKRPVVSGSDAHSFDDLRKYLGKRTFGTDRGGKEAITSDMTWIKADPTFEGLKQIVYEPKPGERVWIGPVLPDQKDNYKVIRKIQFSNTNDFPAEIELNRNLCSIIGSRSSGKSALLAYLAHSINSELAKKRNPEGPGDGFSWGMVKFTYSVEWNNGLPNEKSPGEVVYIPQNYLFEMSGKPEEIKDKIKPVLFEKCPDFGTKYTQAENNIKNCNQRIFEQVDIWFELSESIHSLEDRLKNLGIKKVVEEEKRKVRSKIEKIKEKHKLEKDDLQKYQKISGEISKHEIRINQIVKDLLQIADVSEKNNYFSALGWILTPTLENLPNKLQETIKNDLQKDKVKLLEKVNNQVIEYKESIEREKESIKRRISEVKNENKELIEKYQKNIELEELVKKLNEHNETIKEINGTKEEKKNIQEQLEKSEETMKSGIDRRKSLVEQLKISISSADQSAIEGIKFGVECGFGENLKRVTQKVNARDTTRFVEKNAIKINRIREEPDKFLLAVYSEDQKINIGNDKKQVVQEVLSLTEKILFTAEMEGDKIGGFSPSTMTPGKRALFALRLILAESEDTWPLLIDQPEDDLDSRSIYDDIVPFLKEKKKERQIIMVSHNANLVIGSDSEQIIVTNRDGKDRPNADGRQFNYLTGSIEHTKEKEKKCKDTLRSQGICQHACKILEGGKPAFEHRRNKYNLAKI